MKNNIDSKIKKYFNVNIEFIKLFFILFIVNILIYGQKIFYYSLPADDYMRFYGDDNTRLLITNSARWGQAFMNDYIFSGVLQIMPYLHGIIGIFSFTLLGFLTIRFFNITNKLDIFIGTLLISATPMFAHNLFFSTNITTWITLVFGLYGFMLLFKKNIYLKLLGFLLLVFSIANYQTIIQVTITITIFKLIFELININDIKSMKFILMKYIYIIAIIAIAYFVSYEINELVLRINGWEHEHRLAKAKEIAPLSNYLHRLKNTYISWIKLDHFQNQFNIFYALLSILGIFSAILLKISNNGTNTVKIIATAIIIILLASIPIIINLPVLLGLNIPPRAHFTIGWVIAGFYILQVKLFKKNFKIIPLSLSIILLIINIYYISIFFDAGIRQTNSDILRANLIVNRIRMNNQYTTEPVSFKIVGGRKFNVLGWDLKFEQPFSTHWAKYKIFKYFTDLKFKKMNESEWAKMKKYIIDKNERIYDYPGKNSIIVYKNKVVLFLDSSRINMLINKRKYLNKFKNKQPDVVAKFNIYLEDNIIYYKKEHCNKEDIKNQFFLRIYNDKNIKNNRVNKNLDFYFYDRGVLKNGTCIAAVPLKDIEYSRIYTGQFVRGKKIIWEINLYR